MTIIKTKTKPVMLFFSLLIGVLFGSSAAYAQFASGGTSPVNITADNVAYQDGKSILTGGVDVRQGDVRVLADEMTVFTAGGGSLGQGDISRIIAVGSFYYLTPEQSVRGSKGVYTRSNDTFVVTGDVIMKQKDGSIISGDKLFYNLSTQNAQVVGSCKGRKCGSKGRVNILIKNAQNAANSNS
jgi:lipopolysaccharide export system protein LptA